MDMVPVCCLVCIYIGLFPNYVYQMTIFIFNPLFFRWIWSKLTLKNCELGKFHILDRKMPNCHNCDCDEESVV